MLQRLKAAPGFLDNAKPPMTGAQLSETEPALGCKLPAFLRELYTRLGNGGFPPEYGLMGGVGGYTDDQENTIVTRYTLALSEPDKYPWPDGLVDVLHWGCACYTVIDCLSPDGTMVFYDPGHFVPSFASATPREDDEPIRYNPYPAFRLHAVSLEAWYADFLDGQLEMGYDKPHWMRNT